MTKYRSVLPGPPTPVPYPPVPLPPAPPRRRWRTAAAVGAAMVCVFVAGAAGVLVGAHLSNTRPEPASQPPVVAAAPTSDQVRSATVDLCTRWAAGYRAMRVPQTTGFDLVPTINYISDALRDNLIADPGIRTSIVGSLGFMRQHAAVLSGEPPAGAIQPPPRGWQAEPANRAAQRVWDLCRAYRG